MNRTVAGSRFTSYSGFSLNFDGLTAKVLKTSETAYNLINYSIETWVNCPAQADKRVYAEGSSLSNNPFLSFSIQSGGQINITIRNDAAASLVSSNSTSIIGNNIWHHLIWTDQGGTAKLYVDSVLDATNYNYTRGTLTLDRSAVGCLQRNSAANFYLGLVKKFRVYNSVLTQAQVTSLYYSDLAISGKTLDWEFNEGSGLSAIDSSGNGNTGVITTATYSTTIPNGPRSNASARTAI